MVKYDSLRKLDRNKDLQEYAEAHPELSLLDIGAKFGISGSRAGRLLPGGNRGLHKDSGRVKPPPPIPTFSAYRGKPWNKKAVALAKELGVSLRTIKRAIERLEISCDEFNSQDEELIRNNIPKLKRPRAEAVAK